MCVVELSLLATPRILHIRLAVTTSTNAVCDWYNLLTESSVLDIEACLDAKTGNLSSEEREELLFRV